MITVDPHAILNLVVLTLLVVTSVMAVVAHNLLVSTVILSIFSLFMAVQYLILGAPDVAITESAVGAGISTILLLVALLIVGDREKKSDRQFIIPLIIVCITTVALVYAAVELPIFGSAVTPAQSYVAAGYIALAPSQTGIPNMVTSILASYRGFDTFGEVTVIFTAAVAAMLLLGKSPDAKDK